jgi:hypothetical protein
MIELLEFEYRICKIVGKDRNDVNIANGVIERIMSKIKTPEEIHIEGAVGEFVVAKFLNVYPDFTTEPRRRGAELMFMGWKVDAKNRNPYRDMMTPCHKQLGDADIYVCVTGEFPKYEITGWCWENELIRPENVRNFGYRDSYFLEEGKLHNILNLKYIDWNNI